MVCSCLVRAEAAEDEPVPKEGPELSLAESRAHVATSDIRAALAATRLAAGDNTPALAVALAHIWAAAGKSHNAKRALPHALAAPSEVPERVRLQAHLVDAWLCYPSGDHAPGRRPPASASVVPPPRSAPGESASTGPVAPLGSDYGPDCRAAHRA